MTVLNLVRRLALDTSGQDLIEYALLAALLALATLVSTQMLGSAILNTFWVRIGDMLDGLTG